MYHWNPGHPEGRRNKPTTVPFLAVLPAPLAREQVRRKLMKARRITSLDRAKPPSERVLELTSVLDFYHPTPRDLGFAFDFDCVLRAGYQLRNEVMREAMLVDLGAMSSRLGPAPGSMDDLGGVDETNPAALRAAQAKAKASPVQTLYDPLQPVSASGLNMTLLGIPMIGKSATINRVLQLYPQCISRKPLSPQVVWLKLDCPPNDDLTAFCRSFFVALDHALKQECYSKAFGHEYASKANMAGHVLRLANIHSLGVLVVDKIEALGTSNGETKAIWHLLNSLSSTAGVPVITIGTMAAADHITGSASVAFRNSGLGSNCWMKMRSGEQWFGWMQELWTQQWTNPATPLTAVLSDTMYACCQGVLGLAVMLFRSVQYRLISANVEREVAGQALEPELITPELVAEVFLTEFAYCHEHVEVLRTEDPKRLRFYPDLRPLETVPPPRAEKSTYTGKPDDKPQGDAKAGEAQAGEEKTASDEQVKDKSGEEHQVVRLARTIIEQAGATKEQANTWITELTRHIDGRFDTEAREFMRRIELKIRAWQRTNATWVFSSKAKGKRSERDLRSLLNTTRPVIDVLEEAGMSGSRLFGRR